MKAKVLATEDIIDVVKDWDNIGGVVYVGYADKDGNFYQENELELNPDTSDKVIEGWVTKDSPDDDVIFHFNRPYLRKDYPDDIEIWESIGSTYLFAQSLFPDLSSREPKRYRITITPMD
ncbi:MAG: hypothetical protein K2N48_01330 [Muribaculaceae bacterium]|nr:hypothetical protein [Muribaculaceae bacterium]